MVKGVIFDWIGTLYKRDSGIYAPVPGLLEKLSKDYKLALITVTAQGVKKRQKELDESGIAHYFNPLIMDTNKTSNQFLDCIWQMDLPPEEVAVVGDRMYREIQIGNLLDCETYWIKDGYFKNEEPNEETGEPTHIITHIEDITKFL